MLHLRALLAVLVVVVFAAGCQEREAPLEAAQSDTTARPAAYEPPRAAPDSLGASSLEAERAPVDTLFTQYDAETLAALRPDTAGAAAWADSTLRALSLRQKIGQLFIIDMPGPEAARRAAAEHGVGGFLVSRVLSPQEVYAQTSDLQPEASVPLFFAADYERGAGRFANNFTELPSNMALGATRDPTFAAAAGRLTAIESRALGVNLLFAPVVDVNNNPDNPIINLRSYGGDPALVGEMGAAFVRAAETQGLRTTLKHFPGHGNTSTDSHTEMGVVASSPEAFRRVELAPYRAILQESDVEPTAVMSTHLWIEAVDPEPTPATFSERALRGLLRDELGFRGLVITDDVKMGALQNDFPLAERVVRPLEAGANLVLTPRDLPAAIDAVEAAVQSGRLAQETLDESARRILEAKARAGLHTRRTPPRRLLEQLAEAPRGRRVAQAASDRSLTLLKTAPVLPLRSEQHVALIQLHNYRGAKSIAAAMDTVRKAFSARFGTLTVQNFDLEPDASVREAAVQTAQAADVAVLALHLRLASGRGEAGLYPKQRTLVRALLEQETPVVLVVLGNPYAVNAFPSADAVLVGYDQTITTVRAAARVLDGTLAPQGRLPIALKNYPYGSGLTVLVADR